MPTPKRFLDLDFPHPYFDIEEESEESPTGFQVIAGHLKEAFLERSDDGAYLLRSVRTSSVLAIRAIEVLDDGVIRCLGDGGEDKLMRIRPFQIPT
jgi:hypothetical protein